ncbi:hypothetical protein ACFX11_023001 [Malus domestica]
MAFQQTLSSHSVFFIPWDTPANNPSRAQVFHIIRVESKSISYHAFSLSFLQPALALEYSSSYAFDLFLTYKGSEDDTSKMWRQRADSSSTRDKEKESKRWALGKIEERNRPTPLPRACPSCRRNKQRRMQLAQSSQRKESEMKN